MRHRPTVLVLLTLALTLGGPAGAPAQTPTPASLLRIAFPQDDGGLTPNTFRAGYALMTLVYDTLTWRDEQGVARPWLATSVRRDPGGRRVTVRLHPGVRWHDGRRLTAADVVFSYRYFATHEHPRFTPQVRDVASVTATDATTVVFTLRRASLGFADQPLADVPILPRHLWATLPAGAQAPAGLPVGSGPYRLVLHETGRRYRFAANATYFRGVPSVARIDVPIIRRQDASVQALRSREVDAAPVTLPPGAPTPRIPGVQLAAGGAYTGTSLVFNLARPTFAGLAARRAVSEALDLNAIAGRATGPGRPVIADHGVLHPTSGWANAGILHRFDEPAARVAFAEQGIGALRVLVPVDDAIRAEAGRRVAQALRRVGARARLVAAAAGDFDRALGRRGGPATFDLAVLATPALASYDPAFLRAVYGDPRDAPLNDGAYRSAGFERVADRVAAATSIAARRRAVSAELRLLARDLPSVPLFFGGGTFAFRPARYDGWVPVAGTGILDKRSFLDRRGTARAGLQTAARPAATDPIDRSGGDRMPSLLPIILGFGVILAGVVAWHLRARPRRQ